MTARARARLTQADFYYCAAFDCRAVYFSHGELFEVEDLRVPVFHKQTAGKRIVCYCLEIREDDADFETSAVARVRAFVRAGSCTCEATNPEGRCCLANFRDASSAAATVVDPR